MRIYMQTIPSANNTPRFYQLVLQKDLLEGWTLIIESGIQGGAGKVTQQHFAHREDAENDMLTLRDKQIANGYRVVFVQGQESP